MIHKSINQLKLYPPETRYFIKAKNFETGDVKVLKDITIENYPKNLAYLKYLNASGYNVFLSPRLCISGGVYILLDDLKKSDIERLYKDGFEPFYFLQTSPDNYQAIIELSDSPLDTDIQSFISLQLAGLYGADVASSDIGHFFRLAGFTNRKQKYCQNSLYPFIKFYAGIGKSCTKGKNYIDRINAGINNNLIEMPPKSNIHTPPEIQRRGERKTLETGCNAYIKKVFETGSKDDLSALDFKAALYALKKGFKADDIVAVIQTYSPNLETRKKGHIDDYLARTVRNARKKTRRK